VRMLCPSAVGTPPTSRKFEITARTLPDRGDTRETRTPSRRAPDNGRRSEFWDLPPGAWIVWKTANVTFQLVIIE
jgi:hypothetical protein